jgi:LmbE family N-acetylglucosaminyl deacetylase
MGPLSAPPAASRGDANPPNDREIAGEGTGEACWQAWPGLSALPLTDIDALVPPGSRAVMLAPHPDDELLAWGGLIRLLALAGRDVLVVAVTDGDASHPGSALWSPAQLALLRAQESLDALAQLEAGEVPLRRLGLGDGRVTRQAGLLASLCDELVREGDVLFATWRLDGHPDHEAVGAVAADVARRRGLAFVETPVWMWHWAQTGDARVPWDRTVRLPLDAATHARKLAATGAFASQLEGDPTTGAGPIVPATALARVTREHEFFFLSTP